MIDYTGQHGGLLAMAFAAGCVAATTFWMIAGAWVWKVFFDARIEELRKQLIEERIKCDRDIAAMHDQITQLQTMLMLHGPQALRNAMQAVVSEQHVEARREDDK